jgi:hypothetical protein
MPLNLEKRPTGPPKSGENPEIVVDGRLKGAFSRLQRPLAGATMGAPFGLRFRHQTTMDDDLENVQRYPVELWPEIRPVVGRPSWFEPIYPYYGTL